jgi:septal ring factor EnvC (AmiA/AmiB activator)
MKFLTLFLLAIGLLVTVRVHAQQPGSDELKKRMAKYNEQLQELNKEYEETANNKRSSLKQLNNLKAQIELLEQQINSINSQVRLLDNQISENNTEVHNLQSQLQQLKKQYASMILFAYRNHSAYNKLMFIFAAKDFNQGYKRMKYLQEFAGYRQQQAESIESTQKDLHVKINELDNNKKEKSNALANQIKERLTLDKRKKDQAQVISDLSKQQGQLKEQQRDLQRKIARTNSEIRDAIRREVAEAKRRAAEEAARLARANNPTGTKPTTTTTKPASEMTSSEALRSTPEGARISDNFLENKGHLSWPVSNGIPIRWPGVYTIEGIRTETDGVEIKTNAGAPVRAVFEGKVAMVTNIYGTLTVVIQHGEYFTSYSNLKSSSVSKDQKVTAKQMIGTVATDPTSGDATVQFAIYKSTNPVNPKLWLQPE